MRSEIGDDNPLSHQIGATNGAIAIVPHRITQLGKKYLSLAFASVLL